MAEVNANWLAEQVEGSEEYRELERQYESVLAQNERLENENAALREAMHNLRIAVWDAIADVRAITASQVDDDAMYRSQLAAENADAEAAYEAYQREKAQ